MSTNGTIVNVIEAIRSRLAAGILSGQPLYGVKGIRVGTEFELRQDNDTPFIVIHLVSGSENPNYHNQGSVNRMVIDIVLTHRKLNQSTGTSTNTLFKTSDGTGALYALEALLNVLDLNGSGNKDLTFGATVKNRIQNTYRINEENDFISVVVTLELETRSFSNGSR